jgi:sirohydrochlorin cobaltochelatase
MTPPADTRLLLFAHGSRDPRWRAPFERLEASLRGALGDECVRRLAYMEFVGPTLLDAAADAERDGKRVLRVLPLFLSAGAHVATDIPAQAAEVRRQFPNLTVEVLAPIGEDPRFIALMTAAAAEALERR